MKKKKILILILLCAIAAGGLYLYLTRETLSTAYLASETKEVTLLDEDLNETTLPRGSEISLSSRKKKIDEEEYVKILSDEDIFYVREENICTDRKDSVKEKELYSLRRLTVLKDHDSYEIAGVIEKNTLLSVTGYASLLEDGSVDYYLISDGATEGYVPGAYLNTEFYETAYDTSIYAPYYDFGGGEPSELVIYPKDEFKPEGNQMPEVVKALYINAEAVCNVDGFIELARSSGINSFVVDIKDCYLNTQLAYESRAAKLYAPSTYNIVNSFEDYQSAIKKLKDEGYYVIGRITAFKDDSFARDNPDDSIFTLGTPYEYGHVYWPSIFSRKMWEYDLALAYEAVEEMGFNEIQFDYVRFPEFIPEGAEVRNSLGELPAQAIIDFLSYATERLHHIGAYVSADVFGETSGASVSEPSCFVTAYGQFWPAISNTVDVISSMPYPDHFSGGSFGIGEPWAHPGDLMSAWAKATVQAQSITYDPAIVRTWIQAQSSDSYGIYYGASEVASQIKALSDCNFGGYMTWNSPSSLNMYSIYLSAFE